MNRNQREVLSTLQLSIVQPEWHVPSEVPVEREREKTFSALQRLIELGMVERRYRSGSKQRLEYRLTDKGRAWRE